jgi:hypothetical protein
MVGKLLCCDAFQALNRPGRNMDRYGGRADLPSEMSSETISPVTAEVVNPS